jgi:hypothetical protein
MALVEKTFSHSLNGWFEVTSNDLRMASGRIRLRSCTRRRRHLAALAGGFEAIMLLSFNPYEVAAESGAFTGCCQMLVFLRDYYLNRFGGSFFI